ncbi:MAG: extracellular solute-binding protein [Lachnospiraceae bacterium]
MKKKKIWIAALAVAVLAVIIVLANWNNDSSSNPGGSVISASPYEETYMAYLNEHGYDGEGEPVYASAEVPIDLSRFTTTQEMEAEFTNGMLTTGEEGKITWSFQVEEEGFYHLKVTYLPIAGTTSDIQRRILIDGVQCYEGLSQIVLKRRYQDEEIKVKNENEIRPSANEVFEEATVYIEDYSRRTGEPFLFYLTKGEHTLTIESAKEAVAYTDITFTQKEKEPAYAEVIDSLKSSYPVYTGELLIGQAERRDGITTEITKSSSSINIKKNYSDANNMPYHPYHIIYNTIGGDSFKTSGDFITWEVEVPEEGLYELTFKGRQSENRGVTSYRRMYINGEVPYAEMNTLSFDYSSDMKNYTVSDEEGNPYLFYLKKGSNTITLEVVLGEFGGVLTEIEESMYNLNQLYLKTIQLTGQVPSQYIDYEVAKKVPNFVETLAFESERLMNACNEMVRITGEKGENTALLEKMAIEAKELSEDPESVIKELNQWKSNIAALGTWIVTISEMPLELDCIILSAEDAELPNANAGFFKSAWNGIIRFFASFFVKTNEVTSDSTTGKKDEVLTVWMVSSGKEQAQILQNMIDETFTPNYDIPVKLQLIPLDVVLRAALTGNGPDVLVGLNQSTLADFAMRNALVDLSKLPGYEEEASRYFESAITGASYQEGVFGLAEQQTFMMTFYRSDILEEIGAEVPKTWDDVKELIPVLQRNNYDFYMPKTEIYSSMVFQYGGDYYLGEGKDYGIASGLASDEAMQAFKDLTDFFTCYKLQVSVDFPNRFRTGEMPVGITSYTTFCNLEIFAPEIKGLWSFAPFPGVEKEDGTIDNTFVTDTVQSVIMKNCDDVDAAWTFVKWWTGTETQLQYANTIEAVMGTAARYPAADKAVLEQLPWSSNEYRQLLAQMEHTKGIPAVPGNYMATRMVSYSFDDVVANSSNPRETLYLNMKAIDKELAKKRAEFSLSTELK